MSEAATDTRLERASAKYTAEARRAGVPEHCIGGLVRYIVHGIPPGSFLHAVLSDSLMDALGRADDENINALPAYGRYLYNSAPGGCFRSPERVAAWIARGGLSGVSR